MLERHLLPSSFIQFAKIHSTLHIISVCSNSRKVMKMHSWPDIRLYAWNCGLHTPVNHISAMHACVFLFLCMCPVIVKICVIGVQVVLVWRCVQFNGSFIHVFFFFFYGSTHCPTTIVCYNSNHNFSTYLSIRKCNLQVRVQVTFLTKKKVMSTPNVNN